MPFLWALGLMVASGFAALGCQIVWTQQAAVWLGHESAAVLAVLAAFFGGLALGALALGGRIERSARPRRWYAACEALIGLWGVAVMGLHEPLGRALAALTGPQPSVAWQWGVGFAGTLLLLLPATVAMGATLPAMERVLAGRRHSGLAALYAGNTAGAVLGVLAAAFWLVPTFGLLRTAALCAALNLLCAALAWWALREPAEEPAPSRAAPANGLMLLLAATGLLGIGYEVLAVRVLSQVAENTVFTFALLLAVYLVGTALGAAACQRWLVPRADAAAWPPRLLQALAATCLLGSAALWQAQVLKEALLSMLGDSYAAALAAEALLAAAAFALPTFLMGALFSLLALQARAAGLGFGRALGVNTLGAALAPALFGLLLVPAAGPKLALLLLAAGYALLAWRGPRWGSVGLTAMLMAAAVWAPPLLLVDVPEGGRLASYREGALGAVSVVEDASGVATLRINNRQQEGSSATRYADARQALLPLLLHPAPRQALFLGLGTGVTAASAAQDAQLQVTAVELLPEVVQASARFTEGLATPRLQVQVADARRWVRSTSQRYDLIVADNFHPARSGSAALYTVEHFRAVGERLAPGGLFCQWLPLHQLDLETLRSIVRSFVTAHPQAHAVLATLSLQTPVLGLVARAGGEPFDVEALRARLRTVALPQPPAAWGLGDDWALLGSFVAGPRALAAWSAGAELNTDDHPVVATLAPRITYAPDSLPQDRLLTLLPQWAESPAELLRAPGADTSQRLAAYWAARNQFLAAGRRVQPSADPQRMLAQVGRPLLEALHTSPDFAPAYEPLLRLAAALADSDPAGARGWLQALRSAQPARPEAAQLLSQLH
jgi:spermidine synthase